MCSCWIFLLHVSLWFGIYFRRFLQYVLADALCRWWYLTCGCDVPYAGVAVGYYAQDRPKNYTSILKSVDTHLYPKDSNIALPDVIFYDMAWFMEASFGNRLKTFEARWGVLKWLVDRFHFLGHSLQDLHCTCVPPYRIPVGLVYFAYACRLQSWCSYRLRVAGTIAMHMIPSTNLVWFM